LLAVNCIVMGSSKQREIMSGSDGLF
jgi:hypothetical protein